MQKLIACETVARLVEPLLPPAMPRTYLKFGLHLEPEELNRSLQDELDRTGSDIDTVLFGYGLCSKGMIGLHSSQCRLVIPRVDDCIGICLGSRAEYHRQCHQFPGTFYLNEGWIEAGDDPYTEFCKLRDKYGHEKAWRLEEKYIGNYTRVAYITSSDDEEEHEDHVHRKYAALMADFFGLDFEVVPGCDRLLRKLLSGDWDDEFVVVEPGQRVTAGMFLDEP